MRVRWACFQRSGGSFASDKRGRAVVAAAQVLVLAPERCCSSGCRCREPVPRDRSSADSAVVGRAEPANLSRPAVACTLRLYIVVSVVSGCEGRMGTKKPTYIFFDGAAGRAPRRRVRLACRVEARLAVLPRARLSTCIRLASVGARLGRASLGARLARLWARRRVARLGTWGWGAVLVDAAVSFEWAWRGWRGLL